MRYREPSICLRTTDFSETSQVVHFLTRGAGVVGLLAKGAKRPKSKTGGMMDMLSEGELIFSSGDRQTLGTLIEFSETASHSPLRKDAARLNIALYMLEVVGVMLAEADPHPEVFDLLHNGLARLAQADAPLPAVLAYFQWRLLRHVGLLGDMTRCVSCGKAVGSSGGTGFPTCAAQPGKAVPPNRSIYFSSRQGGLLCADCESAAAEKYRLDDAALAGLSVLHAVGRGAKGVILPENQAKQLNRLLAYHIASQLGKPPKMAKHAIA